MKTCRHCIVSGRVQGVFFRDTTRKMANQFGVTGYARNQADGTVAVLACGDATAVDALCEWLWQGPDSARVDGVVCETREYQSISGFTTG